eukprot:SAG22_NODE_3437_length_1711_cov_2.285183_2_plen_203_part_00
MADDVMFTAAIAPGGSCYQSYNAQKKMIASGGSPGATHGGQPSSHSSQSGHGRRVLQAMQNNTAMHDTLATATWLMPSTAATAFVTAVGYIQMFESHPRTMTWIGAMVLPAVFFFMGIWLLLTPDDDQAGHHGEYAFGSKGIQCGLFLIMAVVFSIIPYVCRAQVELTAQVRAAGRAGVQADGAGWGGEAKVGGGKHACLLI